MTVPKLVNGFSKIIFSAPLSQRIFFGKMLGEAHSKGISIRQPKIFASEKKFKENFCRQISPLFLRNFSALGNVFSQ
jgi:hypothetical protein